MKRVNIESPLSGDFARNIRYARLCCIDSLRRGEAPFASHLLFTQMLDDEQYSARRLGMQAGTAWAMVADLCAVYVDFGESAGMLEGIKVALAHRIAVERRTLPTYLMEDIDKGPPEKTRGIY